MKIHFFWRPVELILVRYRFLNLKFWKISEFANSTINDLNLITLSVLSQESFKHLNGLTLRICQRFFGPDFLNFVSKVYFFPLKLQGFPEFQGNWVIFELSKILIKLVFSIWFCASESQSQEFIRYLVCVGIVIFKNPTCIIYRNWVMYNKFIRIFKFENMMFLQNPSLSCKNLVDFQSSCKYHKSILLNCIQNEENMESEEKENETAEE